MNRDDEFRPRPGKPRSPPPRQRFLRQVMKAAEQHVAGSAKRIGRPAPGRTAGGSRHTYRGGGVALRLGQRTVPPGQRRVVVKARIVRHAVLRSPLLSHLKYLKRDGVTRDGSPGRLFDAAGDDVDERAFAERARDDRHHFRFMVSPEDGDQLTDLKAFTRDLVMQMEEDLGTRLEWAALAHHNTDNPHIHLIVRGIDEAGRDLVIDRDYITFGLRARAQDLAALELGLQSELEIAEKQRRDIGRERFTGLDRALLRESGKHVLDLRPENATLLSSPDRSLLVGRLQVLRHMDLAEEIAPGRWRLSPDLETALRALGERGDIVKAMNRALASRGLDRDSNGFALHGAGPAQPITGRVIDKGFTDELDDRMHLIVDGIDGRVHAVEIDERAMDTIRTGMVVEVRHEAAETRASDRAIARLAADHDGLYRPSRHLAQARAMAHIPGGDPEAYVEAHVRRLEALRRAGIVKRLDADRWQVSDNLPERAAAFDARKQGRGVTALSLYDLDGQVAAPGATWLDRQLVGRNKLELAESGFGAQARAALDRRVEHLIGQRLAQRRGGQVLVARDLLETLETRDLQQAAANIGRTNALPYRKLEDGETVRGTYVRAVDLSSGRYALIENAREFTLVPWRPVIERDLGREVSGVIRGHSVSWSFGRERGLER